jgi:hypothetical protein
VPSGRYALVFVETLLLSSAFAAFLNSESKHPSTLQRFTHRLPYEFFSFERIIPQASLRIECLYRVFVRHPTVVARRQMKKASDETTCAGKY